MKKIGYILIFIFLIYLAYPKRIYWGTSISGSCWGRECRCIGMSFTGGEPTTSTCLGVAFNCTEEDKCSNGGSIIQKYPDFNNVKNVNSASPSEADYSKISERSYRYDYHYGVNPDGSALRGDVFLLSPERKEVVVSGFLADYLNKNNMEHQITNVMPLDQSDANIIYVSERHNEVNKVTTTIYSYNLKDSEFKKIFSEVNQEIKGANFVDYRKLTPVATWGSRLVIWYDYPDSSPGPCWSFWLTNKLLYLDITNPAVGLKPFVVSQQKIDEEKEKSQKCQLSL